MRLALALALLLPVCAEAAVQKTAPPTDLVLIFDTSGSMNETVSGGRKLDVGKAAMWKFVELLPRSANLGLVAFRAGCDVRTVSPIQKASPEARTRLRSAIAGLRAEGSTPLGYALAAATKLLAGSPRQKTVVILTDGEETCDQAAFDQAADEAWKAGIKVYGIGFAMGGTPSRNFRRLGIYKDAGDDKQLASVFQDIRRSLEKEPAKYDEAKAAAAGDAPAVSLAGRRGHFPASGSARAGRLYATLALKSSYEPRFGPADRFAVLEHGYHVLFDPEQFTAEKVEVLRVRLEEKLNFNYVGAEGFVLVSDVIIE
ncbi:MAG: VWA domain-containing protein [Elusimicrobia bacterium]|nr:VWA domain-containing protein [Elusimicrobiota bacterium]